MGSRLKVLSGKEVVSIFESFGFSVISQRGSHIKLRRIVDTNKETLIIPNRSPVSKGTLKAIINQASRFILRADIRKAFYTSS